MLHIRSVSQLSFLRLPSCCHQNVRCERDKVCFPTPSECAQHIRQKRMIIGGKGRVGGCSHGSLLRGQGCRAGVRPFNWITPKAMNAVITSSLSSCGLLFCWTCHGFVTLWKWRSRIKYEYETGGRYLRGSPLNYSYLRKREEWKVMKRKKERTKMKNEKKKRE